MLGGDSAPVAAIPAAAGAAPVAGPSSIRLVTTAAAPTAARIPSTTMPLGNKPRFAIFGPDPVRRARIVPHMFTVNKCRRSGLPPSPLSPAELADQGVDIDALRAERAAIIASRHSDSSSGTGPAGSAAALAFAVVSGNNARSQAGVSEVVRPPLVSKWSAREVTPHAPLIVQATRQLTALYRKCNPQLGYHSSQNPRRVLTVPSARMLNGGYDNASSNLIMAVGDTIYSDSGRFKGYRVLELLGQGTFGQVVKCEDCETKEIKAVKVIKNKPAYTGQAWVEIKIIRLLNQVHDPEDKKHILRLSDHFTYKNHLCLVFEMLSVNLYELIKQNQFRGVTVQLIRNFGKQMLEALATLKEAGVIHCDLKPENVLLCRLTAADIKVIDFGSACAENHTIYSYIQSRFYRAPEVLFGVPYTTAIDMWSFGCIIAELFLGLPLFPGSSQYNQIARIVQAIGNPPDRVILAPKSTAAQFFVPISAANIALHADAAPPGAANSPIRLPLEPIEVPPEPRGPVLPDGTRAPASTQQLIDHAAIVARARAQQHALAVTPSGMPLFECDANGVPVIRDSEGNPSSFVLKSAAAYAAETNSEPAVMKLYHKGYALIDVVFSYTMKKSMTPQARDKELSSRSKLLHLLQGLLQWDPIRRWTPYIAARHPFFTREPLETFDAAALAAAEAQAAQVAAQQRAALQQQQQIQQQQSQSQSQSRLIGDLKSFSASLAAMRERKAARPSPSAAPAASGGAISPATFAAAASGAAPPGMGSGAGSMEGSDASPVAAPANASAASLPPVGARGAVHHGPRASAAPVASGGTSSVASPTNASEDKAAATAAALYPPHTPPHRPGHPSLTPLTTPSTGPSAAGPFFAQGGTAAAAGEASGSAAAAGAAGAAGAGASAAADGGYGAAAAGGMSPLVVAEQAPQEPTEVATEETEETEQGQ